ncbi:MAG: STAS domain-containing protein [bacterium]|nr:STAS domain-containing protein [bacterium]
MNIKTNTKALGQTAKLIEVQGELDVYTSPKLKEAIAEVVDSAKTDLVIDLNNVRYIDSTGLGVLIGTLKKIRENGSQMLLVCNVSQILSVFSITGLSKILTICDTVSAAETALAAKA